MTALADVATAVQQYADEQTAAALAPMQAQLTALQAQAPVATRYGSTFDHGADNLTTALGPLAISRVYDGGKGLSTALRNAKAAGWPDRPVILSAKYDPVACLDGRFDAEFLTAARQLTPDDYVCVWHEQDVKERKGQFTDAQFHACWTYFVTLARANDVKARWIQIFTGYQLAARFGEYVGDARCDAVGLDPYTPTPGQTATELVGPMLDVIRAHTTKPVGICEIGATYTDPAARTAFTQSVAGLHGRVEFVCWFNTSAGGVDYSIDSNPTAAAAFGALTRL